MCARREEDPTDEINPGETVIAAASTMTTWILDRPEVRLTVDNKPACAVKECASSHTEKEEINVGWKYHLPTAPNRMCQLRTIIRPVMSSLR